MVEKVAPRQGKLQLVGALLQQLVEGRSRKAPGSDEFSYGLGPGRADR